MLRAFIAEIKEKRRKIYVGDIGWILDRVDSAKATVPVLSSIALNSNSKQENMHKYYF